MRVTRFRAVLLAVLLLSLSASSQGAALSNASLQAPYFFVLEEIDSNAGAGFFFTTAQGTMAFDGKGNVAVQGSINSNGTVQTFSSTGTYNLAATGGLQVSLPNLVPQQISFSVAGNVSFDLNAIVASNAPSGNLFSQEILLATREPSAPPSPAFLDGQYFLAERTISGIGSATQYEDSYGTATFDGQGNCTFQLTRNINGTAAPVSGSGTYTSTSNVVSLTLPGRATAVEFGFTPDAALGVGATVQAASSATHDLFTLIQANGDGLGNAGLNGSYALTASTIQTNALPSVGALGADYQGNGTVAYQSTQGAAAVTTAGTIAVSANGSLQFSAVPGLPGSFAGGLGSFGHYFLADSLTDPTTFNLLIGLRTPTQVAAAANAASFSTISALSPGALVSIFGRNLGQQTVLASSLPLPTQMAGASVTIGGLQAPLLYVSPFQVNLQVPFELQPSQTSLTVVLDGVESGPLAVTVGGTSPGMFTLSSNGKGGGIFLHGRDFSLVTAASPARPGEVVLIYATGIGAVLPAVTSGSAAPANPLAAATASVSVQINGIDAGTPAFAGLAPGFAGLYQINVTVPPGITTAGDVPVIVTAAGIQSNTVTMPVSP